MSSSSRPLRPRGDRSVRALRRTITSVIAIVVATGLAAAPVSPAVAAATSIDLLVLGPEMFLSPPSAQAALESDNDLLVDVYHDRIEVTESGPQVTLRGNPGTFNEAVCTGSAPKLTCTNAINRVVVKTEAGDDTIRWDQPSDLPVSIDVDCGAGDSDRFYAVRQGADPSIEATANCEYVEVNGVVIVDDLPDDGGDGGLADYDDLVVVPRKAVAVAPTCPNDACKKLLVRSLSAARDRISSSGLSTSVSVTTVRTLAAAEAVLKRIDGYRPSHLKALRDDQVIGQKETLDAAFYDDNDVDRSTKRASDAAHPYVTELIVYAPKPPAIKGGCPYDDGVASLKEGGTLDIEKFLKGQPVKQSISDLKALGCKVGGLIKTPILDADPAMVDTTRTLIFDPDRGTVDIKASVPARSDLALQISGRSRTFSLDQPQAAGIYAAELGPLADGTFARAASNQTTVTLRAYERTTGRIVGGIAAAAGEAEVLDQAGNVLASTTLSGLGEATLTFRADAALLQFRMSINGVDGDQFTAFGVRKVVDAPPTIVTAQGGVFTKDSSGAYRPDTTTALSGSALAAASATLASLTQLLSYVPDNTAAAQARAILTEPQNVQTAQTRPAAVLRHVFARTGFELATLHLNSSADSLAPEFVSRGAISTVLLASAMTFGGDGTLSRGFSPAVRYDASGVTLVATSPMVGILGGNLTLGIPLGGQIANGAWVSFPASSIEAIASAYGNIPADERAAYDAQAESLLGALRAESSGAGGALTAAWQASKKQLSQLLVSSFASASGATGWAVQTLSPDGGAARPAARSGPLDFLIKLFSWNSPKTKRPVTSGQRTTAPMPAATVQGVIQPGQIGSINGTPLVRLTDTTGRTLATAQGGGIIGSGSRVAPNGNGIVASGGGNLTNSAGGPLLVTQPANIVAGGAGNALPVLAASLIGNDGAGVVASGGGNIVAGGAGN